MDDREWVKAMLAHKKGAREEFYETFAPKIHRRCTHILGYQDPDVEDLTQETFIAAFEGLDRFEHRSKLETWLTQICIYLCWGHIRKRKRLLIKLDEELHTASDTQAIAHERIAQDKQEQESKLALVRQHLERLAKRCRELIQLRDFEGKSYAELSRIIKAPIGTVMSRLARCKAGLKARILSHAGRGYES